MNRRTLDVSLDLTQAIARAERVEQIFDAALDALEEAIGVTRASVLLFDPDGVMRFKAYRGLSEPYRVAVEGHTPWTPDTTDARPILVPSVGDDAALAPFLSVFRAERIEALAFVPLMAGGKVIGKFMTYHDSPGTLSPADLSLAEIFAAQVAFAVQRTRAEETARRSEERLRFALDAAMMGTWEWDLTSNRVRWSENLERVHGLPPGTFDGTFASYEREIHPDDHDAVMASARRALDTGAPHEVEYRIVAPDGTVRWVEGKGRVEFADGRPVRMTGVCVNVTRRKQAELERLEAAQEASRLKDEFLTVLSHELRTPLNSIVGWVQMLQSDAVPEHGIARALEVIGRNARVQSQLIEDILDVSRIITGKLEIEHEPLGWPVLVEHSVSAVKPAALAKRITLVTNGSTQVPRVEGDSRRLGQVLTNLLSNAVKFTPEGGRIEVGYGERDGRVWAEVRDTGVGIAPEFLPHVFERFRQADGSITRHQGGLGLGLAIARHLVELHNGVLTATSDGKDRGATFRVELPSLLVWATRASGAAGPQGTTGAVLRRLDLSGLRALVVDDDRDARQLAKVVLESQGARVVEADSAEQALLEGRREAFDLILADIAMPGMDGYGLIERLRPLQVRAAAIAVTAYARHADRERALRAGYDAFETKPIDVNRLLGTLETLLARAPSSDSRRR